MLSITSPWNLYNPINTSVNPMQRSSTWSSSESCHKIYWFFVLIPYYHVVSERCIRPTESSCGRRTATHCIFDKIFYPLLRHASFAMKLLLVPKHITLSLTHPVIPGLSPVTLFWFPPVKTVLGGHTFGTVENVQSAGTRARNNTSHAGFQYCL